MTELEQKIAEASQHYYQDGSSKYTDAEFDAMVEKLKAENPNSDLLKGYGFGYSLDKVSENKYKHKYNNICGLEKAYSYDELPKYLKSEDSVILTPKLDGLSVVLYYVNGVLDIALTRGKDNIGIDITDKMKRVICVDVLSEDKSFTGALRGELIMTDRSFQEYMNSHKNDENFKSVIKNPRNCAAGIINSKEVVDDLKYIDLILYDLVGVENSVHDLSTFLSFENVIKWMKDNFYCYVSVIDYKKFNFKEHDINTLDQYLYQEKENYLQQYPVDGVVLSLNNLTKKRNGIYYNQVAYKFKSETAITEVEEVEWNYTKNRYIVPKIKLKTVQLSGTNVSYCTGYNAKYIKDNNINKGTKLEIEKHGEIIPNINRIVESSEASDLPNLCPCCGLPLFEDGVHLVCRNKLCDGAAKQDLLCWLKYLAPVDGLGDKLRYELISSLYSNGLFKQKVTIDSLMNDLPRLKQIVDTSDESKLSGHTKLLYLMIKQLVYGKFTMDQAVKACNIPRFGEVNSKMFLKYQDLLFDLLNHWNLDANHWLMLECADKLGEANTLSLYDNADKLFRLRYIQDRIIKPENKEIEFKGNVCITGKLSVKRKEFESILEANGYKSTSISKSTFCLITDDPDSNTEKNKKANQWNIPKMSEEEFRKQYLEENK